MNQQNTPFATTICNHGRTTAAGDKEDAGMRDSQPNIPSCLSFGGSRRDKTPRESRSADRDDGTTLCSTPASQSDLDISIFKESRPDRSESEGADLEEKKRSAPARRVRARSILASVFHCTTALFCYPRRSSPSPNHNRVDLVSETGDFGRGTETADEDSDAASLASITSVAIQGTIENGRLYAVFGQQEYGMPMDSAEMDRIGLCHAKYFALLDERRFLAPIGDNPQKILDLGCGTGEWTIDVADMLPSAKIIGVDIAPVQRDWVPPNCHFELDDIEQNWTWEPCSFDYIFARDLLLSVRNWPRLIDQIYHHLKPGGWVELQCISGPITCDDSSLPADGPLREFSDLFATATQCFGTPIDDAKRYAGWLRERGFGSVREHEYKIPCNQWPQGKKLKLVGAFELENLTTGLEGMVTRLFSKTMGWSAQEVQAFLVDVKKDLRNEKIRCYWPYTVVYAQKPRGKTVS